ncbi:MAG: DUF2703 domain-containing protein [candidate division WOR-3 bacterium]|nr:DUF2703 domain-containing protein [candidate division WOR-3 bacterium]MCX7756788.1 DUF2703 domain-containing protein [candidate division WOR-3 bacterium]MDW7987559.1 DUF2703 domain-containing protein [candidate division WOR-3 bacterium]
MIAQNLKELNIRWQRLVKNNRTCPRCRRTEKELIKAYTLLKKLLKPLGIKVTLKKEKLTLAEFRKDPLKSNQILINNKPLEKWLSARKGESPCCDICGPVECRTVETQGKIYETIPQALIIRACLKALVKIL